MPGNIEDLMPDITTILFDVGWPIIDETRMHAAWNKRLIGLIKDLTGRDITDDFIQKAETEAVTCYAPSLFSYVIWQAVKPDQILFNEIRADFDKYYSTREYVLQDGILKILENLSGHFKLGLAANQPVEVYEYLKNTGILKYFDSTIVSGEIGYSKPDIRMFMAVLDNLKASPEESMMIGDRQDNDIIPAKLLGMTTVRLLIGPHKDQIIRYPSERPDYEISNISEILDIPPIKAKIR
jgi:putative hydrolase of the HAD superfamily